MPTTEQTTELHISGMTCTGCTNRVTNVLERLQGVREARVTLEDERALVDHDPAVVDTKDMKEAVERAGYTAEER